MKIRNGFVSNSSSSSFVIFGAPITEQTEATILELAGVTREVFEEDYYSDLEWFSQEHSDLEFSCLRTDDSNNYLIGTIICYGDTSGYLESTEFSLDELDKIATELSNKFGISKEQFTLRTGTRAC